MVGQGVLRECLLDGRVESVLSIARSNGGTSHPKFRQIVLRDLSDYSSIESQLAGYDACFFCLGVSSAGMKEEEYRRVTYGITLAAAEVLARLNPQMTFIYVSGVGTDSTSSRKKIANVRAAGKREIVAYNYARSNVPCIFVESRRPKPSARIGCGRSESVSEPGDACALNA
jgi:hypothetical protein